MRQSYVSRPAGKGLGVHARRCERQPCERSRIERVWTLDSDGQKPAIV